MRKPILTLLLAASATVFTVQARAQLVIIANPNMKVTSISKEDVRDIFTGASSNLRFGPHARPVLMNRSPVQDEFLSTYIGVKDPQFRSNWSSLVFAGQLAMPPSVDSEAAVVDYVAHHIFTIGYIRKTTPHEGVMILTMK